MASQPNRLNNQKYRLLYDYLKTVCTRDGDGYSVYAAGHSDESVAEHMRHQFPCSPVSVRNARVSEFGMFRKVEPQPSGDRLDRLERQLMALCAQLGVDPASLFPPPATAPAWAPPTEP
jgi:hypothetical protein